MELRKTFLASEQNEGSAKHRDQRHALWSLERCHFFSSHVATMEKAWDFKGASDCDPLSGMGRCPLSKANAVELDLKNCL